MGMMRTILMMIIIIIMVMIMMMMAMLEVAINIITGLIVIMFVIKTMSPINCAIINYTSSC